MYARPGADEETADKHITVRMANYTPRLVHQLYLSICENGKIEIFCKSFLNCLGDVLRILCIFEPLRLNYFD